MPMTLHGRTREDGATEAFSAYGFGGGLNIKSMPQELDDSELTIALNVYLRTDGGLEQRKGMTTRGALLSGNQGKGVVRFFQEVVNGAPLSTANRYLLAQVGDSLYNVDSGAMIGAAGALGTSSKPWSTVKVYDADHAGGASDVLVICTGVGGPYIFDGTSISTPPGWASIAGARWCTKVNGVTWFGGIPAQPNLVVGSVINHPEQLLSFFSMSESVTGLATLGAGAAAGCVVGMVEGISVIYGTGPSNFYQQDFTFEDGVAAGRTMLAVAGAVFFLGGLAVWRFDGQSIVRISDKVEPWILNDPLAQDFPMNGDRRVSFAWFYNNRLHFAYDSSNAGYPTAYLVFDLTVGGWTVLFGPKLNGACLLNAPGDTNPPACVVIDATKGQAYNWDVYNGTGTNGHGVDDAGQAITATFATKYFKIEEPGCGKKLVRIYPEMFVESFTGQVVVTTNYGASQSSLTAPISANQFMWDSGSWDQANWASSAPAFFNPKLEVSSASPQAATSIEAEAFAFGLQNSATDPPFRFAGLSGELVYEPRS